MRSRDAGTVAISEVCAHADSGHFAMARRKGGTPPLSNDCVSCDSAAPCPSLVARRARARAALASRWMDRCCG
eukprot:3529027-Prymnesium_polylepis.1